MASCEARGSRSVGRRPAAVLRPEVEATQERFEAGVGPQRIPVGVRQEVVQGSDARLIGLLQHPERLVVLAELGEDFRPVLQTARGG
jgi:hypothetical protein